MKSPKPSPAVAVAPDSMRPRDDSMLAMRGGKSSLKLPAGGLQAAAARLDFGPILSGSLGRFAAP